MISLSFLSLSIYLKEYFNGIGKGQKKLYIWIGKQNVVWLHKFKENLREDAASALKVHPKQTRQIARGAQEGFFFFFLSCLGRWL